MPNRNLSAKELEQAHVVLAQLRARLKDLATGDDALLFAFWRSPLLDSWPNCRDPELAN